MTITALVVITICGGVLSWVYLRSTRGPKVETEPPSSDCGLETGAAELSDSASR